MVFRPDLQISSETIATGGDGVFVDGLSSQITQGFDDIFDWFSLVLHGHHQFVGTVQLRLANWDHVFRALLVSTFGLLLVRPWVTLALLDHRVFSRRRAGRHDGSSGA